MRRSNLALQERRGNRRFALDHFGATRTQQSMKRETDINVIVERFGVTGMLPQRSDAFNLGAYDGVFDYQSAMNAVVSADRAFLQVPAKIRARFENDPQKFAEFVCDPANEDECRKLKLWKEKVEPPKEVIQKVEVVNSDSVPPVIGGIKP